MSNAIDLTRLREYVDNDKDTIRELIGVFIETSLPEIQIMKENRTDGENKNWSEAAHKLKGASGFLGAEPLRLLCEESQNMLIASAADRNQMMERIEAAYRDVCLGLKNEKI